MEVAAAISLSPIISPNFVQFRMTGLAAEAGVFRAEEVNPIYTLLLCVKNHREKVPEYATHDPDNQD